ncbi:MAG: mechanosensitive ion channel family protein [Burkholderiales bacterium]|nr:mechanosensitive ion channel family protein [Burkholderiales bacterium]
MASAYGRIATLLLVSCAAAIALAQSAENPLKPPDRSSPRAALRTFLESADALAAFMARDYLPSPSRAEFDRVVELSAIPLAGLDLSALPPAAREKTSRAAALALYEVLNRIPLPAFEQIPDADGFASAAGGDNDEARWVIPDTEIALVRVQKGPRRNDFLFSTDTVARAVEYYERVRHLPVRRTVPIPDLHAIVERGGGWMIPHRLIQSLPPVLRAPLAEQALWKWIGLVLVLVVTVLFLRIVYRVSLLGSERNPFLQALAQFTMPVSVLAITPALAYLALVQLNLIGAAGVAVEVAATVVLFLAGAWMSWRLAPVLAEAIIASPRIAPESVDAHLIRVSARLLAIVGSAALLALGADRLGLPVYGIVAGLGVGGLAIALAARPTIENLIGGMNLFADKPIRAGDLCKYGNETGFVEAIGIRSTRIRGLDRTLTTIPNALLATMPIENLSRRDEILVRAVIGVRYETTPEQLRYILVRLREMLLGHPRIDPNPARVRFVGFGSGSLDIELFAYATTRDRQEFFAIQEDILLRVMEIVAQAGASIAFPSRTLYFARDRSPDGEKVEAAEAHVRAWRADGALPFPNFSDAQARALRGSIAFPPPGSAEGGKPR